MYVYVYIYIYEHNRWLTIEHVYMMNRLYDVYKEAFSVQVITHVITL